MKYARALLSLTGSGKGAAATVAQLVIGGVVASALATTLPSTPTRLMVYELAAWLPTRTPSGGLTGSEVGNAPGLGDGAELAVAVACPLDEADGDAEWLATLLLPPQAVSSAIAARAAFCSDFLGAETWGCVPIRKRPTTFCAPSYVSGTIHPLKQGADPHPQGSFRRGSPGARRAHFRKDGRHLAVRFVLSEWR